MERNKSSWMLQLLKEAEVEVRSREPWLRSKEADEAIQEMIDKESESDHED